MLRGEREQVRIRLSGIDAPERRQPFGTRVKQFLADLCAGQVVTIRQTDVDRYGRIVADVVLPDGRVANHEIVRAGLAWWFRKYAPNDDVLARLEGEARKARRGLWSEANPIPPWEWRRGAKVASTE